MLSAQEMNSKCEVSSNACSFSLAYIKVKLLENSSALNIKKTLKLDTWKKLVNIWIQMVKQSVARVGLILICIEYLSSLTVKS